jgi:hypothetical protein
LSMITDNPLKFFLFINKLLYWTILGFSGRNYLLWSLLTTCQPI